MITHTWRTENNSRSLFRSPHSNSKSWRDKATNWASWASFNFFIALDWSNSLDLHSIKSSTSACFWPSWIVLEIKTWLWMGNDNRSSSSIDVDMDRGTTALSWSLEDPPPPLSLPLKDICNRNNDMIENMLDTAGGFTLWWLCLDSFRLVLFVKSVMNTAHLL